jgi:hypothetical protein
MVMVVHPRNEGERKFIEGFYEALKKRGFSRVGYAKEALAVEVEGMYLEINKDDLTVLAENPQQADRLFAIYTKVKKNPNSYTYLPDFKYVDRETIALAKPEILEIINKNLNAYSHQSKK